MNGRTKKSEYLFLLPAGLVYVGVIVIPIFYSFYLSLFKWNGIAPIKKFVGLRNYINLFIHDTTFLKALSNNIIWVMLTMTVTVSVALMFALLLNNDFRGRTIFRGIFYFPYVLSGVVVALIWTWVYHPQLGLITNFVNLFGLEVTKPLLANIETAFFSVYAAALWQGFGAPMVLFLAGLQTIPKELFEAAKIDGANVFQNFIHITIPMLRETFVIVFATQIISSMKVYDIVFAMTAGGPAHKTHTLATWMVQQTFEFAKIGSGTAIACIMVVVLMAVIIPYVNFMAKE